MSDNARIRPPWWLKFVNKGMIGAHKLGIGFGGKGPVVLTVPGRKTGKPRSTPVTPMTVDIERRAERCRMVEVPVEEARPLLRELPAKVPTGVGFIKNAGLVTGPNPDEFEALAGRCPVFRLAPVNA